MLMRNHKNLIKMHKISPLGKYIPHNNGRTNTFKGYNQLKLLISANMAQIVQPFMPMNQESIWLIFLLNSAITVSHMHIPPKHLLKDSGWGKEIILWSFEQNESDIKLNFLSNSSAYTVRHIRLNEI